LFINLLFCVKNCLTAKKRVPTEIHRIKKKNIIYSSINIKDGF